LPGEPPIQVTFTPMSLKKRIGTINLSLRTEILADTGAFSVSVICMDCPPTITVDCPSVNATVEPSGLVNVPVLVAGSHASCHPRMSLTTAPARNAVAFCGLVGLGIISNAGKMVSPRLVMNGEPWLTMRGVGAGAGAGRGSGAGGATGAGAGDAIPTSSPENLNAGVG